MVSVWSAIVFGVGLAGFAILLSRLDPGQSQPRTRALIALVPGVIGAFLVGTLVTDLVPDPLESAVTPWLVAIVTVALIILTVTSLARR